MDLKIVSRAIVRAKYIDKLIMIFRLIDYEPFRLQAFCKLRKIQAEY